MFIPKGVGHLSGRSSAWLERYVRDVEVARSNRVAPINREVNASRFFYFLPFWASSPISFPDAVSKRSSFVSSPRALFPLVLLFRVAAQRRPNVFTFFFSDVRSCSFLPLAVSRVFPKPRDRSRLWGRFLALFHLLSPVCLSCPLSPTGATVPVVRLETPSTGSNPLTERAVCG